MPRQTYLHQQANYFHFRRRIPGLSTYNNLVQVSLGTTDEKLAHNWLRTLISEFDAVLDDFITIFDELPEELIAHYVRVRLRETVRNLRRQQRMERMTGRRPHLDADRGLRRLVTATLLNGGIEAAFPAHKVDPDWTPDELALVMELYADEVQVLTSPSAKARLIAEFETVTGFKALSLEHECQILEAYLHGKLAALSAGQNLQSVIADVYHKQAKALIADSVQTFAVAPNATTTPVVTNSPKGSETESVTRPSQASAQDYLGATPRLEAAEETGFTAGVAEIFTPLTIKNLRQQQLQAEKVARTSQKVQYGSDIASVCWRMAIVYEFSKEVINQRAASMRLFCLMTGIQRVNQIRQHHFSSFRDLLGKFPKHFLRSNCDETRTIEDIIETARSLPEADVGFSHSTKKKHLKSLELLLDRAKSEGHVLAPDIDLKVLRPKQKGSGPSYKKRPAFKAQELKKVFSHSLWQGAASEGRRHNPGSVIIKDSRYLIPLILAYTGARRAEIAGLAAADIQEREGQVCFVIQANEYRGIKGEASGESDERNKKTRIVPVHSHLIDLGIMEHAAAMIAKREGLLFPDVVPVPRKNSKRSKAVNPALLVDKYGESIDYMWKESLNFALGGNPRKLCMHSMRHYVNDTLLFSSDVKGPVRYDLIGHVDSEKEDINSSVYRDESPMALKVAAIESLPRLFY